MAVYKAQNNTWYCKFYYYDFDGNRHQKMKRGFSLKRDAQEYEAAFLSDNEEEIRKQREHQKWLESPEYQLRIPFTELVDSYLREAKVLTKHSTYRTKESRVKYWILPYFKDYALPDINASLIREWQVWLKQSVTCHGKPLADGYLQTLFTELSNLFNYAIKTDRADNNPCIRAGNLVGKKVRSTQFWTKEQFDLFISTFDKKDRHYTAFMMLYYCGMRVGELEALTVQDIDLINGIVTINKTFHMHNGEPVITSPKTEKSNRQITMPRFLCDCIGDYISRIYAPEPSTRLFTMAHSSYGKKLNKHSEMAKIERIRVHDLRHSHVSLLVNLGFSAVLIAERLGHEDVTTTLNIYTHLFPTKQTELAEKMQELYG